MVEQPPDLWRAGLSALLSADSEQSALDAIVALVGEWLNGPAVGILKSRIEYLSSMAAHGQERLVTPLFVEALGAVAAPLPLESRHALLLDHRPVLAIVLRDDEQILGAVCGVAEDQHSYSMSPYLDVLELAFVRTVQRIRHLAETRLLYDISLHLGSTLDLSQLLNNVLALTTATFAASSSRMFLYDERMGDLVMTLEPSHSEAAPAHQRVPLEQSVAGWVVRQATPVICNSDTASELRALLLAGDMATTKLICVPLKNSERTLGALMIVNHRDRPDFTADDLRLLTTVAGSITMMITNARLYQRAIRDALTGAYNRGAFDNAFRERWNGWESTGEGFALILLDLDDFKQINDRFGHSVGDTVLQIVTRLLWEALREEDAIYRYGGEEFCVLMNGITDPAVIVSIAERLRVALDRELTLNNLVRTRISASVGVAIQPLHGAASQQALLDKADDAAYRAKRGGKNQVVLAQMTVED